MSVSYPVILRIRPGQALFGKFLAESGNTQTSIARITGLSHERIRRLLYKAKLRSDIEQKLIKAYPKYHNYFAGAAQDKHRVVTSVDLASLIKTLLIHDHLMPISLSRITQAVICANRISINQRHVPLFNEPVSKNVYGQDDLPQIRKNLTWGATDLITDTDYARCRKLASVLLPEERHCIQLAFRCEYHHDLKSRHRSVFPQDYRPKIKIKSKVHITDSSLAYQTVTIKLFQQAPYLNVTSIQIHKHSGCIWTASGYVDRERYKCIKDTDLEKNARLIMDIRWFLQEINQYYRKLSWIKFELYCGAQALYKDCINGCKDAARQVNLSFDQEPKKVRIELKRRIGFTGSNTKGLIRNIHENNSRYLCQIIRILCSVQC